VHTVSQVLIGFLTGRALPKKFFGSHIGIVALVVCGFKDELIDFQAIVVHGG
jgi:hypothetical protein